MLFLAVVGCSQREPVSAAGAVPSESLAARPSRSGLTGEAVRLVKDINVIGASADPRELANVNGTVYFSASDGLNGIELWKSDGTAAGTVLVKDISPGPGSSTPGALTNINGTLYFRATDGVNGVELWKSDGTTAGTVLVKDITPGSGSTSLGNLTNVNGTVFFSATDGVNGNELWKSDGTAAGTVLVKDIYTGFSGSSPEYLTNVNGTLYFSADSATSGKELWKSNGTAAGTVLVKDIHTSWATASNPSGLTNVNGTLFFTATDGVNGVELWKSNGTAAGTVLVKDIFSGSSGSTPAALTNVNGTLYFRATDGVNGVELWKSDGTAAGTVLFKDIASGSSDSTPELLTNVNGTLYFRATDSVNGGELWKSDGTAAGTVLVKDLYPGSSWGFPEELRNINGTLYFAANNPTAWGLWKSDGTAAGTVLVKALRSGSSSYGPLYLTDVDGTPYFSASDGVNGIELWKSDGTTAGTVTPRDINPSTSGSNPLNLANLNGTLYFNANDGVRGEELWKSDGTEAGTVLVKDFNPGAGNSFPYSLTNVNGTLFLSATDGTIGTELWKSDGTTAGTVLVKDIYPGPGLTSSPRSLMNVNGTLFFTAMNGTNHRELWKSDGTAAGTVLVKDINPGTFTSDPQYLTNVNGTLYFTATNGTNGVELWKSDGTAAGTVLVKDIFPGTNGSSPAYLTNVNGTLFFTATDGVNGWELWKSDGTAAGTVLFKDLNPGSGNGSPAYLTNINGTLYFTATDGVNGVELWKSDGTAAGTVLVKDLNPGSGSSYPASLTNVNGTLYFAATDSTSGTELWKSDGTAAGTVLVKDLNPGSGNATPIYLTNVNGTLYFTATNGTSGMELWKSDGTAAGTVLVHDFFPGVGNGYPSSLFPVGEKTFFAATTPLYGAELWMLDNSVDSVPPTVTCPADQSVLATSASGALVTYPPATATDDQTASPRITYSVDSGSLFALGSTAVTVTATDDAGNTARCGFTVAVVPPAPTVTAPLGGTSSLSPVPVAGTALQGATVSALEGTTVLGTFTADASGAFGGSLALESRVYTLRFTQTLGGATSAPTAASTVSVRPPPPSLTAPSDGLSTTAPGVSVSGSGVPGATLTVREGEAVLATLTADGAGTFAGTVSLGYGVHVLRFTQSTSGGTSEEASARTVTVQPAAPVLTRPARDTSLVGPTVLVEGTGLPGATARVLEGSTSVGTFVVAGDGTFAGSVTLAYGSHTLTAMQAAGGQMSTASASVSFEVRPAAPDVVSPADGATSDGPKVAVTGSGVPGARVEVREAGTVLATLTADASGGFAGEVELAPGTHGLTFVQQMGGATSEVQGPRRVSVRPPAPVLTAPASKARVPGPEVMLEGRALAGARVSAEESGLLLGSTSADPEGVFRLRVSLARGPHSLSLQQEAGGLTSPARSVELTVIPAPPVLSQPLDGATVGSRVEVKGLGLPLAHVTLREGTEVLATIDADADGAFGTDVSLAYGPHTLTAVQRVEGEESDASAPVHLNVVFNRAPIADAQELPVAEDGRLVVELTASDADDDRLTFTVRTPPAHGSLEGTPPALTYVPEPDFHGADRFTFAVSDGELEATATVLLTVTPVNDAPAASALAATTGEGQPVSLTLSGGDVDGDGLSYEVVTGPAHGSLKGTPPEVTYTPVPGFVGTDAFSFRVSDGERQSLPATVSVRVVATTLTVSVSDLQPLEGSAVTFSAALADASAAPVFTWDFGDGTTSSEATPRHAFRDDGVYTVRVQATDADGTRHASVIVTARNAAPVVEALSLPDSSSEAQEVMLSATAVDPAGSADTLEYLWSFGDGSSQASGPSVRHAFRDDGPFTVVLTVRDEDGGETRAQSTLTVSNVPPSATAPERQSIKAGESLSLQLSASDVAGAEDPLTWKKLSGPGAVTPEGTFTWAPAAADVGEASVRLEVSDDEGGRSEVTLIVEVLRPNAVDATGCGCRASGGSSGLFALLLGLGVLARSRRPSARAGLGAP
ncbi:Flagellar hook-length control protein FliK [Archangium gephyra]|uniref:Flagellar hook-length control protein FliK n=1 Tax=Archangium gephyra TaxID=48 RepID=A0AAC8Q7E0_9BACT|nr:Flagellar hook-length control protein FliK [Archangium gephyra]